MAMDRVSGLDSCAEPEDCVIAYKLYLLTGMRHRNSKHSAGAPGSSGQA